MAGDPPGPRDAEERLPAAAPPGASVYGVGEATETVRGSGAYLAAVLPFEFLALMASRSVEVRGARWEEVDFEAREWRIPTRADEDEPEAPGSSLDGGACRAAGGAEPRGRLASGIPVSAECSDAPLREPWVGGGHAVLSFGLRLWG